MMNETETTLNNITSNKIFIDDNNVVILEGDRVRTEHGGISFTGKVKEGVIVNRNDPDLSVGLWEDVPKEVVTPHREPLPVRACTDHELATGVAFVWCTAQDHRPVCLGDGALYCGVQGQVSYVNGDYVFVPCDKEKPVMPLPEAIRLLSILIS